MSEHKRSHRGLIKGKPNVGLAKTDNTIKPSPCVDETTLVSMVHTFIQNVPHVWQSPTQRIVKTLRCVGGCDHTRPLPPHMVSTLAVQSLMHLRPIVLQQPVIDPQPPIQSSHVSCHFYTHSEAPQGGTRIHALFGLQIHGSVGRSSLCLS